jgi:serine/threonine-protein kinase
MSKLSLDTFLALVERSGLIDPERLTEAVNAWKRRATIVELDDAQFCSDHLVEIGLLTPWQAKKLLEGRHRGFFLGKYRLLDHLGSGGMSSVYLAEHTLMQRLVAIKVLPQHRVHDASYLARFRLEGQCTAALDHPNIVRAYDLDSDERIHYLVMEYVDGQDLQALVQAHGPLAFHVAADFTAQAAAGLSHAHAAGLVHRDIKPANLLVDRHGTVKILDMGLAKFPAARGTPPELSRDDQVLGTADYVAPEQTVNSAGVDPRADIYSLGCTLYFLLTGHPPYPSGSPSERMIAHQRQPAASILDDRPDAPATLLDICRRMMEKSPLNRFQTAGDVHRALTAWLESEAAAGRIARRQVAAIGPGEHGSPAAQSGVEPWLGSGSSLGLGNDATDAASRLADTETNVQRSAETMSAGPRDPAPAESPSTSHSHVLLAELARLGQYDRQAAGPPAPPPVAIPPAPAPAVSVRAVESTPFAPAHAVSGVSHSIGEAPLVRRSIPRWAARNVSRAGARWPWVLLLSSLIIVAIMLALFAAAH